MKLPIRFPREEDTIFQEARAYRRLAPTDRLLTLLDLIQSGMTMMSQSPHRDASLRLQQAHEAEWRRLQKELFARHGC